MAWKWQLEHAWECHVRGSATRLSSWDVGSVISRNVAHVLTKGWHQCIQRGLSEAYRRNDLERRHRCPNAHP
ncbi:hypothetical protein HBI18_250730, partial [Parastagonospora nodorum]